MPVPTQCYHIRFDIKDNLIRTPADTTANNTLLNPSSIHSTLATTHTTKLTLLTSPAEHQESVNLDWRFSPLVIKSFDAVTDTAEMAGPVTPSSQKHGDLIPAFHRRPAPDIGPNLSRYGTTIKARFVPVDVKESKVGWGIVHLYREYDDPMGPQPSLSAARNSGKTKPEAAGSKAGGKDDDGVLDETQCTTLCIPAVPIDYDVPKFLAWVGPNWIPHVAHWRLVMTQQFGSYLALIKFRDAKKASLFRDEFEGRLFPDVGRVAHALYIRTVTFQSSSGAFPDLAKDPFLSPTHKPLPPPTADLVELPTCPVCLERMDDTSGLMTIHCQHIFHCNCLENWTGSGCPVCRYTAPARSSKGASDHASSDSQPFGRGSHNMCSVCDCTEDLWICLICGRVGCGRYRGGHAKEHFLSSAHCFALEIQTQHVWDYAEDKWVHRLLRNKDDGKIMELPSSRDSDISHSTSSDTVPRTKVEGIGVEYTHLLTSQLESQRLYFEDMVNKAIDKASQTATEKEKLARDMDKIKSEIERLRVENETLTKETVPQLERDLDRENQRAEKLSQVARTLTASLQDEKKVSEGLLERVKHNHSELEQAKAKLATLEEENRDLTMFISFQEKLKDMEESGKVDDAELRDSTAGVAAQPLEGSGRSGRRRRGQGRR